MAKHKTTQHTTDTQTRAYQHRTNIVPTISVFFPGNCWYGHFVFLFFVSTDPGTCWYGPGSVPTSYQHRTNIWVLCCVLLGCFVLCVLLLVFVCGLLCVVCVVVVCCVFCCLWSGDPEGFLRHIYIYIYIYIFYIYIYIYLYLYIYRYIHRYDTHMGWLKHVGTVPVAQEKSRKTHSHWEQLFSPICSDDLVWSGRAVASNNPMLKRMASLPRTIWFGAVERSLATTPC
jgi:hypothetical protein